MARVKGPTASDIRTFDIDCLRQYWSDANVSRKNGGIVANVRKIGVSEVRGRCVALCGLGDFSPLGIEHELMVQIMAGCNVFRSDKSRQINMQRR